MDIIRRRAMFFEGANGEKVVEKDVPDKFKELMARLRHLCRHPSNPPAHAPTSLASTAHGTTTPTKPRRRRNLALVPASAQEAKRHELIEKVAEVDEELAELYLGVRPRDGPSRPSRSLAHSRLSRPWVSLR